MIHSIRDKGKSLKKDHQTTVQAATFIEIKLLNISTLLAVANKPYPKLNKLYGKAANVHYYLQIWVFMSLESTCTGKVGTPLCFLFVFFIIFDGHYLTFKIKLSDDFDLDIII